MNKYEIVLNVVQTGNISKSAKELNYSQSAISQAIKNFEKEIGFPIFNRTNFGVQLLPAAESVVKSLEIIAREQEHLKRISDAMTQSETGTVRIGSFISFAMTYLPAILKEFKRLYPLIKFNIFTGNQREIHEALESGTIDIAFTSKYGASNFKTTEFMQDEFMAVLPLEHPLTKELVISIDDLRNSTYIYSGEKLDFEIGEIIKSHHLESKQTFDIFDELVALKLIEAGFGVSIFSHFFLQSIPNHANVAIRPFREHFYRSLVIAENPEQFTSAASILFKNFTEEWLMKQLGHSS